MVSFKMHSNPINIYAELHLCRYVSSFSSQICKMERTNQRATSGRYVEAGSGLCQVLGSLRLLPANYLQFAQSPLLPAGGSTRAIAARPRESQTQKRMGLDTETGSHELRLQIKHVIPFNPCSLAELETPHAQASRTQGSCSPRRGGQGQHPLPDSAKGFAGTRWCRGRGSIPRGNPPPPRFSVCWWPYCGTGAGP